MARFVWPVQDHSLLGDGFHARGGEHQGQDIGVSVGTPVFSSAPGRIVFAGSSGGYGFLIRILHEGGYETRYGHLSKFLIRVGDYVTQGIQIALSGGEKGAVGSGDSTGPHLHFEIRHDGIAVDPIPLLDPTAPSSNTNKKRNEPMFGFVRNPAGEIAIVNPATGRKRALTLPEWTAYSTAGATYAQLSDADYNGIPNQ